MSDRIKYLRVITNDNFTAMVRTRARLRGISMSKYMCMAVTNQMLDDMRYDAIEAELDKEVPYLHDDEEIERGHEDVEDLAIQALQDVNKPYWGRAKFTGGTK